MSAQQTERKEAVEAMVTATEASARLPELVGRAGFGGERFVITNHGEQRAALIGIKDLERLRALDAA